MIIVKITILSFLITLMYIGAIRLWAEVNYEEALSAQINNRYPIWMYFICIPLLIDIFGLIASAIWFLFFYL